MTISASPIVILVRPQLGENIGMAARAMLNGGLTEMRLVRPRDGWPNEAAWAAASGADRVLDAAVLFDTVDAAIADLNHVYATTARSRAQAKPIVTARQAGTELRDLIADGRRCGVLFGPERAGLENDEVAAADTVLTVPLNPDFTSLNLAQAVLLLAYEWYQAGDETPGRYLSGGADVPAPKAEFENFMSRLVEHLERGGFMTEPHLRHTVTRNLRNAFQRAAPTEQELRTLHGAVKALTKAGPAE
ncbi:RNA methyltransferase [Oceanibaculum pacificum]|uniref:rRNA methyltransferase n=1 Tax=Oceanibaculum pacificum TaxID=580166 RepID=A0A154WEP8_9PROT|nr:RNA methyltransferase [Oceanibaculum pacificum]KZD12003.1 rRNA methyltransferase [Oceanibaculum pacificum]